MSWHVPNEEEIDFILEVFRDIVEPTLGMLEALLEDGMCFNSTRVQRQTKFLEGVARDEIWRNDFCR